MNRSSFARFFVSALSVAVVLVTNGCGGGGGNGGDNSFQKQNQVFAPPNLFGQSLVLGDSGRQITFRTSGNVWIENRGGTVGGGSYQYTANGNTAEIILSENNNELTIRLQFSNAESGVYTDGSNQGTFTLSRAQGDVENPGGSGNENDTGRAPGSIEGRILHGTRTFTSTGPVGQTHIYTFSNSTFHDSDPPEESGGTYVYQVSGAQASLILAYVSPQPFNGDRHELNMTFLTESGGTFESVYTRRDGTLIQINGTFQLQ